MSEIIDKYASLLTHYCLQVKKGDRIYITSSYLAQPLLLALAREMYLAGGLPHFNIEIPGMQQLLLAHGDTHQLQYVHPLRELAMDQFECYLNIRAPYERGDGEHEPLDKEKNKIFQQAQAPLNKRYFERIGDGTMRRGLCQYPTQAGADDAGMTLAEYEHFVYQSCYLYDTDPAASWLAVRRAQQAYVDRLNMADQVQYKGPNIDITFSVKGRTWINSDGRSNMPSGEVFSAPIEDSMNGWVYFSYPTIYMGKDVQGIRLEVTNGTITSWQAETGQEILDKVFAVPGARQWGEVAVGTNMNIQRITRNILFDEKIGGSIHMAVGQSYKQCGGRNESTVHWDMITDMRNGGQIIADGEVIYQDGVFVLG
jgi:aminopeptidase